jgi:uncharacterized protein YgbK (DUF1537 family)
MSTDTREALTARELWETIKILGLSNEKLALEAIRAALATQPAQPSAQGAAVAHTSERHFALREAHCIAAGDAFWAARPGTADDARRIAFDAGFVRGFDAGEKVYASAPAAPAPPEPSALPVAGALTPLTHEQIKAIRKQCVGLNSGELYAELFARAIERAHGIAPKAAQETKA